MDLYSAEGAECRRRRRRRNQNAKPAATARVATPPITPPAIAPAFVLGELEGGDVGLEETVPVGLLVPVDSGASDG